jgi:hypothetical protein
MRTIILVLIAATLSSCKEYTCHCTLPPGTYTTASVTQIYKESSKKKATARCDDEEARHTVNGDTASCGLE